MSEPGTELFDAAVVGAGPAGCTAAVLLARAGRRVLLLEKRAGPAHKLCGEFLSTEVMSAFERLGVLDAVRAAGAHPIRRSRITDAHGRSFETVLPGTALGLSRFRLDALLLEHARRSGVEVREGTAVRDVAGDHASGFRLETPSGSFAARLVLGAYGRRERLDRRLGRPFLAERTGLVAFKAHYAGEPLPHCIELHAFPGGYCGVSPVEAERVNVCWIADERRLRDAGGGPERMIAQSLSRNPALADRLGRMRRTADDWQAVSQITFARKGKLDGGVCMIGDTAGMIAPLCGDGMAMAIRSAELAAPLADDLLAGRLTRHGFETAYAAAWDREFRARLLLGRVMHAGYSNPLVAAAALAAFRLVPAAARWLIRRTRG